MKEKLCSMFSPSRKKLVKKSVFFFFAKLYSVSREIIPVSFQLRKRNMIREEESVEEITIQPGTAPGTYTAVFLSGKHTILFTAQITAQGLLELSKWVEANRDEVEGEIENAEEHKLEQLLDRLIEMAVGWRVERIGNEVTLVSEAYMDGDEEARDQAWTIEYTVEDLQDKINEFE
jgi:hypothetical protein